MTRQQLLPETEGCSGCPLEQCSGSCYDGFNEWGPAILTLHRNLLTIEDKQTDKSNEHKPA